MTIRIIIIPYDYVSEGQQCNYNYLTSILLLNVVSYILYRRKLHTNR